MRQIPEGIAFDVEGIQCRVYGMLSRVHHAELLLWDGPQAVDGRPRTGSAGSSGPAKANDAAAVARLQAALQALKHPKKDVDPVKAAADEAIQCFEVCTHCTVAHMGSGP